MPAFDSDSLMPSDEDFLNWVRSGDQSLIAKAVNELWNYRPFVKRIRARCRQRLESRLMLFPEQAFFYPDAEEDALAWIFEKALSAQSLPRTLLIRSGGFDPSRGSLMHWLAKAADLQLRDWLRKQGHGSDDRRAVESHEIAIGTEHLDGEGDEEKQKKRSEAAKTKFRDEFAGLPTMERACMLVRYIDDANETVLTVDDICCIFAIRIKPAKNAPGHSDLATIRRELANLWIDVASRAAGEEHVAESSDGHTDLTSYLKLESKVQLLLAKLQSEAEKVSYYAKSLANLGHSDQSLAVLAKQARLFTLEQIRTRYNNKWTEERGYMEFVRRFHRTSAQLNVAREAFLRALPVPLPEPREIALVLNSTPNAVSSALSRAHAKIGKPLAGGEWDEDARIDDESA